MTTTSKAPTFRIIKGARDRLNIETGVVIRKSEPDNGDGTYYYVLAPTRDGFDIITTERTLAAAREWAIERVELMREVIAEAHDAAAVWIEDELNAAEMAVARVPSTALHTTLAAAFRSLEAGFVPAANARLFRILDHFHGKPFPLDTEVAERLAAAERDYPEHATVKAHRDPEGRTWMVWRKPYVDAEAGRVVLSLSTPDARLTRSAYADEVTLIRTEDEAHTEALAICASIPVDGRPDDVTALLVEAELLTDAHENLALVQRARDLLVSRSA